MPEIFAVGEKRCGRCQEVKEIAAFYVNKGVPTSPCRRCVAARNAARRAAGVTQALERARYHAEDGRKREVQRRNAAKWKARNREKLRVHWLTERAIERGELVRQACQECGAERTHAHHADYSRPLEVMWLCALHHMRQHAREGRLGPSRGASGLLAGAVAGGKGPRRHDR